MLEGYKNYIILCDIYYYFNGLMKKIIDIPIVLHDVPIRKKQTFLNDNTNKSCLLIHNVHGYSKQL